MASQLFSVEQMGVHTFSVVTKASKVFDVTVRVYSHIRISLTRIIGGSVTIRSVVRSVPTSRIRLTYFYGIVKAFAPTVRGQALIATGTGGLHGEATVAIWTYTEKKKKPGIFVTIQRVVPTVSPRWTFLYRTSLRLPQELNLSRILINGGLFFLCCAWLVHFLTGEPSKSTQEQHS